MMCVADASAPLYFRAQNMFRQAMRSPVIRFHVVPASMKSQYEQLSQEELSPPCPRGERGNRGSFTSSQASDPQAPQPGERGSLVVHGGVGLDHNPQRMSSRSRPHPIPIPNIKHQNHGPLPQRVPDQRFSTSLPHSGSNNVSSAPSPSLQRKVSANPTAGYFKKTGRRLNIQLKKGKHMQACRMHTRTQTHTQTTKHYYCETANIILGGYIHRVFKGPLIHFNKR